MKTRLLRSRRTVYILAISLLVALSLPAFSAFAWGGKHARYDTYDVVLEDLSGPIILDMDLRGNIYFMEEVYPEGGWFNKYNVYTGEVTELVPFMEGYWFTDVDFDFWGNVYYTVYDYDWDNPFRIYKMNYCGKSELIYETTFPEVISDMQVDWWGNVYVSVFSIFEGYSYVWKIPGCSNTPELLFSHPGIVHTIQLSPFLRQGIFFLVQQGVMTGIYQYKDGQITELLHADGSENFEFIPYMTLSRFRGLYYLFRERSDYLPAEQFGYVEIGQFTPKDLRYGVGPGIVRSVEFDESILIWGPMPSLGDFLLRVYDPTGDAFAVVYPSTNGSEYQFVEIILWLNARTGTFEVIWTGGMNTMIVLDYRGNVHFSDYFAGTIIRINR